MLERFKLDERVAIITGGGGLLGRQHAAAVAEAGGIPVLWDIDGDAAAASASEISDRYGTRCLGQRVDITNEDAIGKAREAVVAELGRLDILINNAANDPKVGPGGGSEGSRLEGFSRAAWDADLAVGLTGAFLCSRSVGAHMAARGGGVILNVASDLGVIAPDQRIYRQDGVAPEQQPVKPVTYSVIKHGIIGLTKYLATYWADRKVRANSISPAGVYAGQPEAFVSKLTNLIPLGRMAQADEYRAAVLFLVSDASAYMTGANVVIDGGRTCW
jgi:NAD(P)-dependent dehydrogenase (short-subunit alcohol dehydrogenase family)